MPLAPALCHYPNETPCSHMPLALCGCPESLAPCCPNVALCCYTPLDLQIWPRRSPCGPDLAWGLEPRASLSPWYTGYFQLDEILSRSLYSGGCRLSALFCHIVTLNLASCTTPLLIGRVYQLGLWAPSLMTDPRVRHIDTHTQTRVSWPALGPKGSYTQSSKRDHIYYSLNPLTLMRRWYFWELFEAQFPLWEMFPLWLR